MSRRLTVRARGGHRRGGRPEWMRRHPHRRRRAGRRRSSTSGDEPDFQFAPEDPMPGSDARAAAARLPARARGPAERLRRSRSKYLTSEFSDVWDPDALTTIRSSGSGAIVPGADDELQYTFSSRAFVDVDGRVLRAARCVEPDARVRVRAGGRRVAHQPRARRHRALADQLRHGVPRAAALLPRPEFEVPRARRALVPGARARFQRRVAEALLEGPASWLVGRRGHHGLPRGHDARAVGGGRHRRGVATVTLSDAANAATAAQKAAMRQQLAATLGVSTVVLKVGPVTLDSPDVGTPPERPQVVGQPIVGTADAFGFATASGDHAARRIQRPGGRGRRRPPRLSAAIRTSVALLDGRWRLGR